MYNAAKGLVRVYECRDKGINICRFTVICISNVAKGNVAEGLVCICTCVYDMYMNLCVCTYICRYTGIYTCRYTVICMYNVAKGNVAKGLVCIYSCVYGMYTYLYVYTM